MKKYLVDMSADELRKVFDENTGNLADKIMEDMLETEYHYMSEMLDCFRDSLKYWSVSLGGDRGDMIKIYEDSSKRQEYLQGVDKANSDFGMLPDEEAAKVKILLERYDKLHGAIDDDDFNDLDNWLTKETKRVADLVLKTLQGLGDYCYEEKSQKEYFVEFYAAERIDGGYILGDDYETIYTDKVAKF